MKSKQFLKLAVVSMLALGAGSAQAVVTLFEFGLNIDGTTTCGGTGGGGFCDTGGLANLSGVGGVNDAAFDFVTGLGSIEVTVGGVGNHNVDLYLDHEIDEAINTFFNEFGSVGNLGALAAGQSWEIDEPGFIFGDIDLNFLASTLDNTNSVPAGLEDDVAMAMGFDFSLAAGETAVIDFVVSDVMPASFFLSHTDPDSNETIYFSGQLDITGGGPGPGQIPEPSMFYLLGIGLLGMAANRRRVQQTGRKTTEDVTPKNQS